jgi:hypothetical protein
MSKGYSPTRAWIGRDRARKHAVAVSTVMSAQTVFTLTPMPEPPPRSYFVSYVRWPRELFSDLPPWEES